MFTLTSLTECSSAIRSRTGDTAWHGPHHSAQKSTITLPSVFRTSTSNVSVVTSVGICSFRLLPVFDQNAQQGRILPARYDRTHVYPASGQTRSSRSGAGDPGRLGAGADLPAAPRPEPRRRALVVHRRPRDGEQAARRAHGLGSHAEGRLPALQGAARFRPALSERVRLPGPLDR